MKLALAAMAIGLCACTSTPTTMADLPEQELLRRIYRPQPTYPECLSPRCAQLLAEIRMPGDPVIPSVEQQKQWCVALCNEEQDAWRRTRQAAAVEYNRRHPESP